MTTDKLFQKIAALPLRIKGTFWSAIIVGLLTHGYIFTNKLPNQDDLMGIRAYGATFNHGCWLKGIIGYMVSLFCGNYSNPWLWGTESLLCLALAAVFVTEALRLKNTVAGIAVASVMVSFPSIAGNFAFGYMSAYFSLSILFASISAWLLSRIGKKTYGFLGGVIFLVCSMGLYQTYFPFAASILLMVLIKDCLYSGDNGKDAKEIMIKALRFLGALSAAMILYFLVNAFFLFLLNISMGDHKNMDKMGEIDITVIPGIIVRMYKHMVAMITEGYMGLGTYMSKVLIALCWIISIVCCLWQIWKLGKEKRYGIAAMGGFFALIFPIAINLIDIMCANSPEGSIYLLMTYSLCCIYILPIVLLDSIDKVFIQWGICLLGGMIGFFYYNYSNAAYICAELSQRSVESFYTAMLAQIKSTEGYTADKEIVFVGCVEDPTLYPLINEFYHVEIPTIVGNTDRANAFREGLLKYYCGFYPSYADGYEASYGVQVKAMPCYPDEGSIQIFGDQVVVKLSEE